MALVKYIGPAASVTVAETGQVCARGSSITVSSGLASLLLAQTAAWEAGNKETEELVPFRPSPLQFPPVAAAKQVSVGGPRAPLVVNANFTTDGVLTKFKIKHGLASNNVTVGIQTHEGGVAKEVTTVAKVVAISTEEIEITLSAAGASGVTYWVQIHN